MTVYLCNRDCFMVSTRVVMAKKIKPPFTCQYFKCMSKTLCRSSVLNKSNSYLASGIVVRKREFLKKYLRVKAKKEKKRLFNRTKVSTFYLCFFKREGINHPINTLFLLKPHVYLFALCPGCTLKIRTTNLKGTVGDIGTHCLSSEKFNWPD